MNPTVILRCFDRVSRYGRGLTFDIGGVERPVQAAAVSTCHHRHIKNRRRIDRYCLLALTSRGAAILDQSPAPLSVTCPAGAMKCQRI